MSGFMMFLAIIGLIIILSSIRQINEYERGIRFTLGKYSGMLNPGWHVILPIVQSLTKVDVRTKAVDVPSQETLTLDNISIGLNAVIFYRIIDASKAIISVENYFYAISQLAQTSMRNIVGTLELDELLEKRDFVANKIRETVDEASDSWGIDIEAVELKDIRVPIELQRTMAKAAEAEREKRAILIRASAELESASAMAEASKTLASAPGALHLRTLQSINDIASDPSNTTVWMVPIEGLKALEGFANLGKKN